MKKFLIYAMGVTMALGAGGFAQQPQPQLQPPPNVDDGPKFGDPRDVNPPPPGPPRSVVEVVPPKVKVTREAVLRAIALFRRDPVEARDQGMVSLIMSYAEDSAEVHLAVGPRVAPFMEEKAEAKYAPLLLAAFVAGDLRSQLEGHHSKDDPMAGALQVIDTYEFLRKQDASVHFTSVEQWITLQKQGKLRGYLEGN